MTDATSAPSPHYRTINAWAVAALITGVASSLALVNVILIAVPLFGLFLSLAALRNIRRNEEITSGINLARIGLFLAVFMLIFVPVRIVLRTQAMKENAITLSDKVLELLQEGRLYEVHHLSTRQFVGRDPHRSLAEYFAESPKLMEAHQRFVDGEAVKRIADLQRKFKYQLETLESSAGGSEADGFILRYKIKPDKSETTPFSIWISVERQVDPRSFEPVWWFRGIFLADPAAKK